MQTVIWKFAMLTLGKYIEGEGTKIAILGNCKRRAIDPREVKMVNRTIATWLGGEEPVTPCDYAGYVNFSFNIPFAPMMCHVRMKIIEMNMDFMRWLPKFIELNKIEFPNATSFFTMLICNCLHDEALEEITKDLNTLKRIKQIRDKICNTLRDKDISMDASKNEGLFDRSSSASFGNICPMLDFEGKISFTPADASSVDNDAIVIQGLS
eukprot:TRINITY_DN13740_c0_g1_i8.p1 TRINITY_DN13740_c0_g1~~TRINITY_DN13740_c0_g1_i8.p1  ORF type:complete len:210 (-),score=67.30 TRINITY_DN13740_c0_g1_i8:183-812(-)